MLSSVYVLYRDDKFIRGYGTWGHAKAALTQRAKRYIYDPTKGTGYYAINEAYHIKEYTLKEN